MLLLFLLLTLWAMRSIVHRSTGFAIGLSEVDRAGAVGAKVNGQDAILPGREAVAANLADLVVDAVLDRRQNLRKRPRTGPVALRRRRHAERFVRALMIVALAPVVEGALAVDGPYSRSHEAMVATGDLAA